MLARAGTQPDTLVLGLDANGNGMVESAVRAYKAGRRGGLANARFVIAAAEALPHELDGLVDEMTIHFPWGSLLRGLLAPEETVLSGLARVLRPGGTATMLLSLTPHDRQPALPPLDDELAARLAPVYAVHGFQLVDWRQVGVTEVAAAHSSWAKRLGAGRVRPVWRLRLLRTD